MEKRLHNRKGGNYMILFTVLLLILLILVAVVVLGVSVIGSSAIIVFGDVIVCAVFIVLIIKKIIER